MLAVSVVWHFGAERIEGLIVPLGVLGAGACAAVAVHRSRRRAQEAERPGEPPAEGPACLREKVPAGAEEDVGLAVLGSRYSREAWGEAESVVDRLLDRGLELVKQRVDCYTAAAFFPTADGGYRLRRFVSPSEDINADAVIHPGVGVIGGFLKEGFKQLTLREIVTDSMTLYYYRRDAGIRSLMATPIMVEGEVRGAIVVDSREPAHFTDEDHRKLSMVAELCGAAVYYAYLSTEHRLKYRRLAAMSMSEKHFFQKNEVDHVLDKMAEIIPFAIPCDRLTISLRQSGPTSDTAVILRAQGPRSDTLLGRSFSLKESSLIGLVYARNMCFFRNFARDHYEVRYFREEPRERELVSFLAFPLGVNTCKGGILLESYRPDAFSGSNRALLSRLATSAGLAVEKIQVLEQARSLATHDGLTGLNNHRQFQKLLRDQVTRANRYREPLACVLCDIDHFKHVNDSYGHPFGDTVLMGVANCLQESIRDLVDIAARYGGEEFALILVKTDSRSAVETTERIRRAVSERVFRTSRGEEIRITLSFGIAVYNEHAHKIEELIRKADKALYRAKEAGRNRVELF